MIVNMEVENLGNPTTVQCHSIRGMKCLYLSPCTLHLLKSHPPPDILVIYLGSNDLVSEELNSKIPRQDIQCTFLRYDSLMPQTKLVWSSIFPRLLARNKKIDQKPKIVNCRTAVAIGKVGGPSLAIPKV